MYANHRGQHLHVITDELFGSDHGIRILDAGAGTGIAGKAVSIFAMYAALHFVS